MKKGQLKIETVRILESVCKHILDSKNDYDTQDLKKNNRKIEAAKLENKLVPKWEEGLRAQIREYFDEV
jgi:hypothetical protein